MPPDNAMTNLQPAYAANELVVRCSSCGTTLTEADLPIQQRTGTRALIGPESCPVCRLSRLALLRMTTCEHCPLCRSTRVLRTEAVDERGEQLCLCSHCDHIWAAGSI